METTKIHTIFLEGKVIPLPDGVKFIERHHTFKLSDSERASIVEDIMKELENDTEENRIFKEKYGL